MLYILVDLVALADNEATGWFTMTGALQGSDFDFGSSVLDQDQEQFGFANIALDEFTDQVLKASNGNTEVSLL